MSGEHQSLRRLCAAALLLSLLGLSVAACTVISGNGGKSGNAGTPTPTATATSKGVQSPTATSTQAGASSFKVTSVQMSVNPMSIAGDVCGSSLTVTYTAVFNFPSGSPGGTVKFLYTVNNGRGSPSASFSVAPGQTSRIYTFTWSGMLEPDNVYPGLGGVVVTSPNQLTSQFVKPNGVCSTASSNAFKVTGVSISVNPTTLNGTHCGSQFTETYAATFHIAANSPGGTLVFQYTTDNGRSTSTNISLHVIANQTTVTYKFYWKGQLPADHTEPENGAVAVVAPNTLVSPLVGPTGSCS